MPAGLKEESPGKEIVHMVMKNDFMLNGSTSAFCIASPFYVSCHQQKTVNNNAMSQSPKKARS
jgi:hypothetical protein